MALCPLSVFTFTANYSLLDGASQLPQLVDRAKELGMPAIALTDHGVMYGAIELIKVCKGAGVKPIIGNEMYIINGDITKQQRRPRYHQVVLAKKYPGVQESGQAHDRFPPGGGAGQGHLFPPLY